MQEQHFSDKCFGQSLTTHNTYPTVRLYNFDIGTKIFPHCVIGGFVTDDHIIRMLLVVHRTFHWYPCPANNNTTFTVKHS